MGGIKKKQLIEYRTPIRRCYIKWSRYYPLYERLQDAENPNKVDYNSTINKINSSVIRL